MQQPSETWDKMSDDGRIAYLATEVMGWQMVVCQRKGHDRTEDYAFCSGWTPALDVMFGCFHNIPFKDGFAMHYRSGDWNPLTDWNHWRQVELEVASKGNLIMDYADELVKENPEFRASSGSIMTIAADLPTRAKALYLAYQSLNAC